MPANYPRALAKRYVDLPNTGPQAVPGTNVYTDIVPGTWKQIDQWDQCFLVSVLVVNVGPNPIASIRTSWTVQPGTPAQEQVDNNALAAGQSRWIGIPQEAAAPFVRVEASAANPTGAYVAFQRLIQSV